MLLHLRPQDLVVRWRGFARATRTRAWGEVPGRRLPLPPPSLRPATDAHGAFDLNRCQAGIDGPDESLTEIE
jgi:hypothetical protein